MKAKVLDSIYLKKGIIVDVLGCYGSDVKIKISKEDFQDISDYEGDSDWDLSDYQVEFLDNEQKISKIQSELNEEIESLEKVLQNKKKVYNEEIEKPQHIEIIVEEIIIKEKQKEKEENFKRFLKKGNSLKW